MPDDDQDPSSLVFGRLVVMVVVMVSLVFGTGLFSSLLFLLFVVFVLSRCSSIVSPSLFFCVSVVVYWCSCLFTFYMKKVLVCRCVNKGCSLFLCHIFGGMSSSLCC